MASKIQPVIDELLDSLISPASTVHRKDQEAVAQKVSFIQSHQEIMEDVLTAPRAKLIHGSGLLDPLLMVDSLDALLRLVIEFPKDCERVLGPAQLIAPVGGNYGRLYLKAMDKQAAATEFRAAAQMEGSVIKGAYKYPLFLEKAREMLSRRFEGEYLDHCLQKISKWVKSVSIKNPRTDTAYRRINDELFAIYFRDKPREPVDHLISALLRQKHPASAIERFASGIRGPYSKSLIEDVTFLSTSKFLSPYLASHELIISTLEDEGRRKYLGFMNTLGDEKFTPLIERLGEKEFLLQWKQTDQPWRDTFQRDVLYLCGLEDTNRFFFNAQNYQPIRAFVNKFEQRAKRVGLRFLDSLVHITVPYFSHEVPQSVHLFGMNELLDEVIENLEGEQYAVLDAYIAGIASLQSHYAQHFSHLAPNQRRLKTNAFMKIVMRSAAAVAGSTRTNFQQWLDEGRLLGQEDMEKYFFLQSQSSRDRIEDLTPGTALKDLRGGLELYAHALSKCNVRIVGSDQIEGYKATPPFSYGDTICLPEKIEFIGNHALNTKVYQLMVAIHAGLREFGTFSHENSENQLQQFYDQFTHPDLAQDIFHTLEFFRVEQHLLENYKGLKQTYATLGDNYSFAIQDSLEGMLCRLQQESMGVAKDLFGEVFSRLSGTHATVEDSFALTKQAYDILTKSNTQKSYSGVAPLPHRGSIIAPDKQETIVSKDTSVVDYATPDQSAPKATLIINGKSIVIGREEQGPKEFIAQFFLPEWDLISREMKQKWCVLYEMQPGEADVTELEAFLAKHSLEIGQIRREFEMLKPEGLLRLSRQLSGDIDMDAFIEAFADKKAGITPSEKIYTQTYIDQRDIACAIVIDASSSTNKVVSGKRRIIDIEREAYALFGRSVSVLDDHLLLASYSGSGRKNIQYYKIKDFDEPFSPVVYGRIAHIHPMNENRDGTIVRHTTHLLHQTAAKTQMMILIGDENPADYGYKDDYAIADLVSAVKEARQRGVRVHYLSTARRDADSPPSVLEHHLGAGYLWLENVERLPFLMPAFYRNITKR